MKNIAIIALIALAGLSHASYELLLVADKGTNSIHRFDPVSGSYLGAFGIGQFNDMKGMTMDPSTGTTYVLEGSRVTRWNPYNGEFGGAINVAADTTKIGLGPQGSLILLGATKGTRVNPTTGATSTSYFPSAGGYAPSGAATLSDGTVVMISYSGSQSILNTLDGNTGGLRDGFFFGGFGATAQVSAYGNRASFVFNSYSWGGVSFSVTNGAMANYAYSPLSPLNLMTGTAQGHNGQYYATGVLAADPNRGAIMRIDGFTGQSRGTFGSQYLVNPISMASIIAPEPSTASLMLGLAALVLRRRRTKPN